MLKPWGDKLLLGADADIALAHNVADLLKVNFHTFIDNLTSGHVCERTLYKEPLFIFYGYKKTDVDTLLSFIQDAFSHLSKNNSRGFVIYRCPLIQMAIFFSPKQAMH